MKITTEYVREETRKRGYKLIGEYVNSTTKITLEDEEGYLYSIKWDNFKRGKEPRIVHPTNPYSIENIRKYVSKLGYELLNTEYKSNTTKIILRDKEGYLYSTTWSYLRNNKEPYMAHPSNPYSIDNIRKYTSQFGYELISTEYKDVKSELIFKCPNCGEYFYSNWDCFQRGIRCPYCCHNPKPKLGVNTIWDTDRWMCDLGVSEEDAKTHTKCSNDKVIVTCPNCGEQKKIRVNSIYDYKSIGCSCGDGISFSEKILISLLNQLNIKYIREYKPNWSNNRRYDFYFEYNNKKYIIECHGAQHYTRPINKGKRCRTLKEEQKNDDYKIKIAYQNGINEYIVLDCRESNLDYIKNSIINSKLSETFDLSNVDWLKCEEFSLSNKVKEVCEYWYIHNEANNENLNTTDIGKVFNLNRATICRYLKRGKILGWCNTYSPKLEQSKGVSKTGKSLGKPVEILKDNVSLYIIESISELERQSEELFGVKLLSSAISLVCNGKKPQYKGFTFRYVEEKNNKSA